VRTVPEVRQVNSIFLAHLSINRRYADLEKPTVVPSRCRRVEVCARRVGCPEVTCYRTRQPRVDSAQTMPTSQGRRRAVRQTSAAHAPSTYTPVAAAFGLLLRPFGRYSAPTHNVSATHDRISAFNARVRELCADVSTTTHERRPRQCQGGGAMQGLCEERWDGKTQSMPAHTNT
jgi:hypothetical protein